MKSKLSLVTSVFSSVLFLMNSGWAAPTDVHPLNFKTGSRYVRVTIDNDRVYFEDCVKGKENECRQIGNHPYYTTVELKSQRHWEQAKMGFSILGDFALVAGGYVFGTGGAVLLTTAGASSAVAEGTIVATSVTAPAAGITFLKKFNPQEWYRRSRTLSDAVITDEETQVSDIGLFISRLTETLDRI